MLDVVSPLGLAAYHCGATTNDAPPKPEAVTGRQIRSSHPNGESALVMLSTAFSHAPFESLPGQTFSQGPIDVAFSHGPLPSLPPKTFSHGALAVAASHGPAEVIASHGACGVLELDESPVEAVDGDDATAVVWPDSGDLHGFEQPTVVVGLATAGAANANGAAIRAAPMAVRRRSIWILRVVRTSPSAQEMKFADYALNLIDESAVRDLERM